MNWHLNGLNAFINLKVKRWTKLAKALERVGIMD